MDHGKINQRVKIVDTFNGGDHYGHYDTEQEAEAALELQREEFYLVNTRDTSFCRGIAPAGAEWGWDQTSNRFEWSE